MKGAIKIVTELKLPNLAERFNNILEVSHSGSSLYIISLNAFLISRGFFILVWIQERLLKETIGTKLLPSNNVNSDSSVKAEVDVSRILTLPGSGKTSEPVAVLQSSKLSSPSFVRKGKKEEPAKVENGEVVKKQARILDNKGLVNNVGQLKNVGEVKNEGEVKKVGEVNLRSSNPFAKSSNNQERSLLDWLKKTKKNDSAK